MVKVNMIEMPLYSDLSYRYSMPLEGKTWQFTFNWNSRCSQWHMDIRRDDQTPILLGYALVPQYPMTVDYTFEDYGLSGYFILLPVNSTISYKLNESSDTMPEFFKLYYSYDAE